MHIDDYELIETCGACPEQYDVFCAGMKVGYLRLRHGHFTASLDGPFGEMVYQANPNGDGIFDADEREHYLSEAVAAIKQARG